MIDSLVDDFILLEEIGKSFFGKVYKVQEKETGNIYAANRSDIPLDQKLEVNSLLREINILSKIKHNAIVKFKCFSLTDFDGNSNPVIITEYFERGSLSTILNEIREPNSKPNPEWTETKKLINIYGIVSAISYLHSHEIIHRNLNPENILIDNFLHPKVTDFELSKTIQLFTTKTTEAKGINAYYAPEIFEKQSYTPSSDVYSLGIIIYEIVTNLKPYENRSFYEISHAVLKGERPPINEEVPASYKNIIERCWSQEAQKRPTCEEILNILKSDRGFITSKVDEQEFKNYIDYIDDHHQTKESKQDKQFSENKPIMYMIEYPTDKKESLSEENKEIVNKAVDNKEKQFFVGQNLIEGTNKFPKDIELGAMYLETSIENGLVDSATFYSRILIDGKIIAQDLKKAKTILEKFLKIKNEIVYLLYGKIMKKEHSFAAAKNYFAESAEIGNAEAMYELGKLYYKGVGCEQNKIKANEYFKLSADKGNIDAMLKYATMCANGDGVEMNKDEALSYINMSIKGGNIEAIVKYAEMINNFNYAKRELKSRISNGNAEAAYYLAELMFEGKVSGQKSEILNYYKFAADLGIPKAIKKYAYILYYESFDIKKANEYFKKGSDLGDPEMMYLWAVKNERGKDIPQNIKTAMQLMKDSASKGYVSAQIDYGIHLLNGINIPKDVNEAKKFFKLAALKKDHWGQLWYYLMSKNDDPNDVSVDNYLIDSVNSKENPESFAIYGQQLCQKGKIDEALPYLLNSASKGSINSFLILGQLAEQDKKYGNPYYYFKMASYYCHCLDVCGFTTPIKFKVFHCVDCNIDMCEGCAKHCHASHKTIENNYQCGFKCQCGKDGFKNKCNGEFVGETCCYQHLYQCKTCCPISDSQYICKSCIEKCHKNHKVCDCGVLRNFCSCGMHQLPFNFNCHLLKFNNNEESCSETKQMQRWFQCASCGIYGSKIGFCKYCATHHHKDHLIFDLGVKNQICYKNETFICSTCLNDIENDDFLIHCGFAYHKGCLKCCSCQKIIESNDDFKNFECLKPGFFVCKNEFNEYCEKLILNSIKEIFDPTIICNKEDFINSDMIKHSYRLNKNYKYFVPTVTFHFEFSPEDINFEKLVDALPEEMVIVNVERGSTFLTIAFVLTEEFQNSNEKCQQKIENFKSKLTDLTSLNGPIVGNLIGKPILNFPDENSIIEFLNKKSVNIFQNPNIIKRIKSKKIKKDINAILQEQKENCKNEDWKFIIKHFHLYSSSEKTINQHIKENGIEFIAVGMTLIPNIFYKDYKKIKKSIKGSIEDSIEDSTEDSTENSIKESIKEQILYHGTSFSNQSGIIEKNFLDPSEKKEYLVKLRDEGYFGIGIYATDNIFYASMYCSSKEQELNMNEKATILCCKSIYNINYQKEIDEYNVGDFYGKLISNEIKSNYGVHIVFVESKNRFKLETTNKKKKSKICAYEYVFPNSHQIIPICSLTIMRTEFFILWIDGTNCHSNSANVKLLKSFVEENVYYVKISKSIDELNKIVELKKRNKMKVIISFDNDQMVKDSIYSIRKNIGVNFVCLIYSQDLHQKEIAINMENVLFTNNFDDLKKFAQIDLRLECIIPFITEIEDKYNITLNINEKSLLNFNLGKYI